MELKVQQQRRILVSALETEDFMAANDCKVLLDLRAYLAFS